MAPKMRDPHKLAVVGGLVFDLTHECNNQLAFVLSNLQNLIEYTSELGRLVAAYRERLARDPHVLALEQEMDADYVLEDAPHAAAEALIGARRLRELLNAVRLLDDASGDVQQIVDLDRAVTQAAALCGRSLKSKNFAAEVPPGSSVVGKAGEVTLAIVELLRDVGESKQVKLKVERRAQRLAVMVGEREAIFEAA